MSKQPHLAVATAPPDTLSDAFDAAMRADKPGSPVSTLRTATPTPTPTSSSGSSSGAPLSNRRSHSGEFSPSNSAPPRPGHRRSGSGPLIFSAGASSWISSTASSPSAALPAGNICPSGRPAKPSLAPPAPKSRSDVLGTGTGNYGHGSIVRSARPACQDHQTSSADHDELRKSGNEQYRKGHFQEALVLYDRAIAMRPDSAACRGNRAAALIGLRRFGEAVMECEAALRIDPAYARAQQRLASLLLRLGDADNARKHLSMAGAPPDVVEFLRLQAVEKHICRCADARAARDWKTVLRECEAATAAGADSCSMLFASRAEALLHLQQLEAADAAVNSASKLECSLQPLSSGSRSKFCGFDASAYLLFVHAQVDTALGRFDGAVAAAERAMKIDPVNSELKAMLNNVNSVAQARALGNELFNSGKFAEAAAAYGEGLTSDLVNPVLHCNRAACRFKLGMWEKSIEDCNEALQIHPTYTKALLRRAASYDKTERYAESVRDYEALRKEIPEDAEVAAAHFRAQASLEASQGGDFSNIKPGSGGSGAPPETIAGVDQLRSAIALPGVTVVEFMSPENQSCTQITPFVNSLYARYPTVSFLKVDVQEHPAIAESENVRAVPTFRVYKNGMKTKEMICPSQQMLEWSVRHYSI